MVCMALRVSTHFPIQKSAPPGLFPTPKPRNGKTELKRRLFLYEGAVESQNLAAAQPELGDQSRQCFGERASAWASYLAYAPPTLNKSWVMNCWLGDEAGLNLRWLPCIQPAFQESTYKSLPNIAASAVLFGDDTHFGFILASLVTQVAVEDVHSGQRATRGSATVGCF